MITLSEWIPCHVRYPETDDYILISFENFSIPSIGRYEDGLFYAGDEEESLESQGMIVNAWMPLPESYRSPEL